MWVWIILGAMGLGGLAAYLWWQRASLAPGSLARRAPLPRTMALRKSTVAVVAVMVLGACLGTVYLVRAYWPKRSPKTAAAQSTPPASGAPKAAFLDAFPKEYSWTVKPESKPLPPRGVPVASTRGAELGTAHAALPQVVQTPPPSRAEIQAMLAQMQREQHEAMEQAITRALATQAARQVPGAQTQSASGVPPPPPKPEDKRWFSPKPAEKTDIMAPPLGVEEKSGEGKDKQSLLFPQGKWEQPANPLRVIYSSQLLQAVLEQAIVTGESATVRMRLTETLYDKFGQGHVLLPMDTRLLGTVDGSVKYGQTRVKIELTKAELPSGTDLLLTGKGGDAGGGVGVPGKVDNKIGQTILAAGISAVLSVGARAAGGNTSGFQPTIEQDFARDLSQGVNSAGQRIVERSLSVQPEISVASQTPVTVALTTNISLQSPPVIVHK